MEIDTRVDAMSDPSDSPTASDFTQSFDARDWAVAWCKIAREIEAANDGRTVIDEGWMISWFANAIMRGYDEHARREAANEL
jgi:hypothetical protein